MRKTMFLTLLVLYGSLAHARIDTMVVKNKWCTRTDTIVLYRDGWNMLQVFGGGTDPKDIKLRSYDGDLKIGRQDIKRDTLYALAMPFGTDSKFHFAVQERRSGHVIRDVYCIVEDMPQPQASVGFLKGNKVSKKELLAQSLLRVVYPGSAYDYPYKILGYTFKAYRDPVSVTKQVEGAFIPLEIQKIIKDLKPGTAVVFSDIIAVCPDCNSRRLPDIKLLVE